MIYQDLDVERLRVANEDVVRRFIEAINDSWNVEAMRDMVTEDFLFVIPFAPDWFRVQHHGREHALAFLDRVRDLMDPENLHDLRLDTYASDPGEVVAHYRSATTMKSTSLPYCNEYIGRFTVRDGKIVSFMEYLDPIRFVIAIGGTVNPPPAIPRTGVFEAAEGTCKIPIGLAAALLDTGVSPADVLATARLPSRLFDIPGRYVPPADYFALWRAIRSVSGDAGIGIRLATAVKPELTEPLFLAILSAADVAGALAVVSRFKRLLEPQDLIIRAGHPELVVVSYEWTQAEDAPPQVLVDAELAFLVEVSRRGTRCPDLSPRELHLRTRVLEEGAGHAAFFRCPIRLGAGLDAVVFTADDTGRPFLTHNPQLLNALIPHLQANTPSSSGSLLSRVRSVIAERVRGQRPTAPAVARELAMSTRAMQRVLNDHGTTFRRLLDEVRNEHARGYLSSTSFSDGEVSFLLGFDDPNSFYRAFRSWNGMSPSEFRKHSAAGA